MAAQVRSDWLYFDDKTNSQYAMGGIFCDYALRQGGLANLKQLFGYGASDEAFYQALQQEFGLSRQQLRTQ